MNLFKMAFFNNHNKQEMPEKTKSNLALEYSSIGVWEYEAKENRVYFSEGSKQIIGVTNNNFGKNPNDWNNRVHPDDKDKYFQDFLDHVDGLAPMYDNIHRVKCKDGTYKWIRDRGKVVEWFPNGKYKRIIGTHTDVTALKKAESITKNALDIASEQNNRLKNFAHIVTHNLKQHTGNLESLLEFYAETNDDKEKEEIFNHLLSLSNSLSKTIKDLNNIVSVQANKNRKTEKIYLAEGVDNTIKMLDVVIKKSKATINNNIDKKLFIHFNNSYFESVIQNLIGNSIKYKHPDRNPIVTIDCAYDKEKLELKVSDNGLGIDLKKYGNDLFGLYKTFHHNKDAEGVGLYLVKNQIESYGGRILLDSEVGKGATFTIIAPNQKASTVG
ncbi:sensor histidine kinase [Jejuia pallidilutea]|uniref:histidine kinase n=2 Tax=Jejuia pallidilutea TaxID=504487 RepID=A0A098LT07_9FLAO|nr:PAS domain-containing protein [Jejuia pallidilutea]GAL90031.1 diguanylate cyclase [Jejuia pallidilutea]